MDYTVREARVEDAEALAAYWRRWKDERVDYLTYGHNPRKELHVDAVALHRKTIQDVATRDYMSYQFAIAGAQVIGQIFCGSSPMAAYRHSATLTIGVDRDWRGQGVGSALMEHSIQWARQAGFIRRLRLNVLADNARAIRMYEKFGLSVEGRHRETAYLHGRYLDEMTMGLLLK